MSSQTLSSPNIMWGTWPHQLGEGKGSLGVVLATLIQVLGGTKGTTLLN